MGSQAREVQNQAVIAVYLSSKHVCRLEKYMCYKLQIYSWFAIVALNYGVYDNIEKMSKYKFNCF